MAVRPCRHNDGGLCREPDLKSANGAVLVTQGNLSLLSQPMVNLLFPDGINVDFSRPEDTFEMPGSKFREEVFLSIFSPEPSNLQQYVMNTIGDDDAFIVPCDCGHYYLYKI